MEAPQNYTKKPQESQTYLHCTDLSTLYRQSLSRHCLLRGGEGQDKSAKNCQYLFRGKSVISNCTHHHISD